MGFSESFSLSSSEEVEWFNGLFYQIFKGIHPIFNCIGNGFSFLWSNAQLASYTFQYWFHLCLRHPSYHQGCQLLSILSSAPFSHCFWPCLPRLQKVSVRDSLHISKRFFFLPLELTFWSWLLTFPKVYGLAPFFGCFKCCSVSQLFC